MAQALSNLPVGALVKDTGTAYNGTPIIWRVLEHGHTGDPAGTTALESRDIFTLKPFDAKEPNNSDSNRKSYGNNRYLHSNILQWMNSEAAAGQWYTAQHSADQAPDNANVWQQNSGTGTNPYDTEAGFLTNFSADLKAALQTVSKITAKNTVTDGGGYETVSSKIFLLSTTEVGLANENSVAEGSIYAYYSQSNTNDRRKKNLRDEAAKGNYSGGTVGSPWYWWLRTPLSGRSSYARFVYTDGSLSGGSAFYGHIGLAPAYAVLSSLLVSDTTDSDGCYTFEWNASPEISTPSTDLGDRNAAFDVTFSITDKDGDAVSATVKLDGTTKATIASVVLGQTYTFSVTAAMLRALSQGNHTITITATDSHSASGTVSIAFTRTVSAVTISGSDGDLGNKWQFPAITYQIGDSGATQVDVVEKIDGTVTKTRTNVDLNTDITFDMSEWDNLTDEQSHTLVIQATNADSQTATRTWTFTKLWRELAFYTNPITTDAAAAKVRVALNYEKTGNPTVRVEVTNNANAIQPTWEDATTAWAAGEAYTFTNKPSSGYGVAARVTITKNASTERVYINSLGLTFA